MPIKAFYMAVLFIMVIKGIEYILAAGFTKKMALMLVETPEERIVAYGWVLILVAFVAWVSYVRYLSY